MIRIRRFTKQSCDVFSRIRRSLVICAGGGFNLSVFSRLAPVVVHFTLSQIANLKAGVPHHPVKNAAFIVFPLVVAS